MKGLPKHPDALIKRGFERLEDETTHTIREVIYRKRVIRNDHDEDSLVGNIVIDFLIRYSLTITDNPFVKAIDNFHYDFSSVEMIIWRYHEEQVDGDKYRTKPSDELASFQIYPGSLKDLEKIITSFGSTKPEPHSSCEKTDDR